MLRLKKAIELLQRAKLILWLFATLSITRSDQSWGLYWISSFDLVNGEAHVKVLFKQQQQSEFEILGKQYMYIYPALFSDAFTER